MEIIVKITTVLEAPIGDYEAIGNFDKNSSFRRERDRKLIKSERYTQVVKKKFNNSYHLFNLYFVNSPKADKHTEVGVVTPEWILNNLGEDVYNKVIDKSGSEAVNVIFTNNKGAENMPMTAWIMAHRIAHALGRYSGGKRQVYSYEEANNTIKRYTKDILELYGYGRFSDPNNYNNKRDAIRHTELMIKHFFTSVCTFRSARKGEIRDWFEVMHELFAQYITTGKIKFNPVPKTVGSKRAFDSGTGQFTIKDEDMDEANDMLEYLAGELQDLFNGALTEVYGKFLVM